MISLQMLNSILTTQMTSGQLLNDSTAGNTINHLQLTFISRPVHCHNTLQVLLAGFDLKLIYTTHSSIKLHCQGHSCENNHFTFISQFFQLWIICVCPLCFHLRFLTSRSVLTDGQRQASPLITQGQTISDTQEQRCSDGHTR